MSFGLAAMYVFGSVARGTDSSSSDLDLGVLLVEPPASTREGRLFDAVVEDVVGNRLEDSLAFVTAVSRRL